MGREWRNRGEHLGSEHVTTHLFCVPFYLERSNWDWYVHLGQVDMYASAEIQLQQK